MRFGFLILSAFAIVFSAFSTPVAAAQVPPTGDNALTCALLYSYFGDTGPAYNRLVAEAAQLSGRSDAAVRTDLAERLPRLFEALADGKTSSAPFKDLASDACPNTFGVAPMTIGASRQANAPVAGLSAVDPQRCAGLARWFDASFPTPTWNTTVAADAMVRRAGNATGLNFETMDRQARSFKPASGEVPPLIDEMIRCQSAYDTPIPPGVVLAAFKYGNRPGIERGRSHFCQTLASDFDRIYPNIAEIEQGIATNPVPTMGTAEQKMNLMKLYFQAMDLAHCSKEIGMPRVARYNEFVDRATEAARQARERQLRGQ